MPMRGPMLICASIAEKAKQRQNTIHKVLIGWYMIFDFLVIGSGYKESFDSHITLAFVIEVGKSAGEQNFVNSKLITMTNRSKYGTAHSSKLASKPSSSYICSVFTNKRFCKHPMPPQYKLPYGYTGVEKNDLFASACTEVPLSQCHRYLRIYSP